MLRLIAAAAACLAGSAVAHQGDHAATAWNVEPWLAAMLGAAAFLHATGTARLWRRAGAGRGIAFTAAARWWAGWLVLCVALLTPVDTLGAELFSMHMVQHELLMVVAAPLLVAGRPLEAWTWALTPWWRAAIVSTRLPVIARGWGWATSVRGAWFVHALAVFGWHVPVLFAIAAVDEGVHALQHASFLGTALLFWWSVLPRAGTPANAAALASLFTTMMYTGALGALLTFAPSPWYAPYAGGYGLTALEDQQLGGLVMWVPGGVAYLVAALALVAGWLRSSPTGASRAAGEKRDRAPRGHPRRA